MLGELVLRKGRCKCRADCPQSMRYSDIRGPETSGRSTTRVKTMVQVRLLHGFEEQAAAISVWVAERRTVGGNDLKERAGSETGRHCLPDRIGGRTARGSEQEKGES